MSFGTTRKQAELLAFLRDRQHVGGAMPSYDEMAAAIGLHSKSGIARMIPALVDRGLVRHMPNHARSIEVVEETQQALDANTDLALNNYCAATGYSRRSVLAIAVRDYIAAHPVTAAGENQ
jgi:SOS-response transcriptional repressor LexA